MTCILKCKDGWVGADPCPYCNPDEYERLANERPAL